MKYFIYYNADSNNNWIPKKIYVIKYSMHYEEHPFTSVGKWFTQPMLVCTKTKYTLMKHNINHAYTDLLNCHRSEQ